MAAGWENIEMGMGMGMGHWGILRKFIRRLPLA